MEAKCYSSLTSSVFECWKQSRKDKHEKALPSHAEEKAAVIFMITELSCLVKGSTFALGSHTVLGTLTSASPPASAFWRLMTMKDRGADWITRGQYFHLAAIPISFLRKTESANYVECDFLSESLMPWGKEDSPHSAGSALSSAVQDALALHGKGTLLA